MTLIGIPEKLVRKFKMCVQNTKCKISFGRRYLSKLLVSTGLRQGDVLFNIVLESMVKQVQSKEEGIKISDNQQLAMVAYADDVVITTKNETNLKNLQNN